MADKMGKESHNNIQQKRLTAFAFKRSNFGIDIKIIGCFKLKHAPSQPYYSKGIITLNHKAYSVFDLQTLSGLSPKPITEDSCIVLLDPNEDFTDFSRAIIVDNVSEMLRIAEQKMEGLPVAALFGRSDGAEIPKNAAPDFPDVNNGSGHGEAALGHFKTDRKKAISNYSR